MQHDYHAKCRHVNIRPLQQQDIEKMRQWRNDLALSRFLRPIDTITPEMQRKWFDSYLEDSDQIMFAIEEIADSKRLVGSFALYHFSANSGEIGKIIIGEPSAHSKKIGFLSLLLGLWIAFEVLHFCRIHLDVHENNLAARKVYDKLGFVLTGKHPFVNGGTELEMTLDKEAFVQLHEELLREIVV